ncbi:MAG: PepSY-associated TM helix domain-containing protein [Planctomycetes bacterium]|jgi:hypothetical protein|nr:PepSY-associated TM helix domain-containing protein [Planctomycetota bacterium]
MTGTAPASGPVGNQVSGQLSGSGGRALPRWIRWLHIYGSMLGLCATLLFAVTGLTLNHAEWFESAEPSVRTVTGKLPLTMLGDPVEKLEVAERLRAEHGLRGTVGEFAIDDRECIVVWKGPGYSADAAIQREDGSYRLEEARRGLFAVLDDLHKGRDCGPVWSLVIDASAVVLAFLSLTGLWLLLYLRKRRRTGLLVALAGTAALVVAFVLGVR